MKLFHALMFVFFFGIVTCKKDKQTIKESHFSYKITLSKDLTLQRIEYFTSDILSYVKYFEYFNDSVVVTQKFVSSDFHIKSAFFLNNKGFATTCIDSVFSFSKLSQLSIYQFRYNSDGYKTSSVNHWNEYNNGQIEHTGVDSVSFIIDNGNSISDYGSDLGCSFYYEYNSQENRIDINTFLGSFNGRINKNLMLSYHTNCHSSSGTSPAFNNYEYQLNDSNMVVRKIDNYTPSNHYGDKNSIEKRFTDFYYFYK